jgi:hypothetical protein
MSAVNRRVRAHWEPALFPNSGAKSLNSFKPAANAP